MRQGYPAPGRITRRHKGEGSPLPQRVRRVSASAGSRTIRSSTPGRPASRASSRRGRPGPSWRRPTGRAQPLDCGDARASRRPAQADLHRPQLPRPCGGVGARHPRRARHLRQVDDVADRPRRDDRDPARGDAARLRGRARRRDRRAGLPRDRRRGARGRGRLHLLPRRLGPPRAARDAAAAVHVRQELRHVRAARALRSSTPTASTSARSTGRDRRLGRDDAATRTPGT